MRKSLLLSAVLSACLFFPTTALLCGKQRWFVKVAKDPHAKFLFKNGKTSGEVKTPKATTIKKLVGLENPFKGQLPPDKNRVSGIETTIWEIHATIFNFKEEKGATGDNDYHIAIRDSAGNEMVAEIPNPPCLAQTPVKLRTLITKARHDFDAKFNVTEDFKDEDVSVPVTITGPAMFDKKHGGNVRGVANNFIEIHPVLSISFP